MPQSDIATIDGITDQKILISPLDWGLGHAARCVPLIRRLSENDNEVVVVTSPAVKLFLKQELEAIRFIHFIGYNISYSKTLPAWVKIALDYKRLRMIIKREEYLTEELAQREKPDLIISDNRFGFRSSHVKSVMISHQLQIMAPFFKTWVNAQNQFYLNKFNEIWVPDNYGKNNLSGELSNTKGIYKPVKFIGPLSRFEKQNNVTENIDLLILLSGPEPSRSILEEKLSQIDFSSLKKVVMIRGIKGGQKISNRSIEVMELVTGTQLSDIIARAKMVMCRSGYSTLLDIDAMQKKAILVPTPGQPEQEYLAKYWNEKEGFATLRQADVNEKTVLSYFS